MEKLQIALEKARANRAQTATGGVAARGTPKAQTSRGEVPFTSTSDLDEAWSVFPALELDKRRMETRRLLSYEGGPAAAPFDLLRTKLTQAASRENWKRIAVVSPGASAGKTTTMTNLAFALARQPDLRTIALDFDLRRPALHQILGQSPRQGMVDVIYNRVGFDQHGRRLNTNLVFGMNDRAERNSSEVLHGHQTEALISALEETFQPDYMLFDMPPMLAADDAYGFLTHVDAALIVVEAEKTPMAQIDVVERQVSEMTGVLGVVLNKCNYSDGVYAADYGYY